MSQRITSEILIAPHVVICKPYGLKIDLHFSWKAIAFVQKNAIAFVQTSFGPRSRQSAPMPPLKI